MLNQKKIKPNPKSQKPAALDKLAKQVEDLQSQLQQSQEREKRVLADYQNLVRRQRDERMSLVKMASKDFVESLLQPLENLSRAAEQLNDQGLNMVVNQLWQALKDQGLEEIDVMGKKFDLDTMEVVEKKGNSEKVIDVVNRGYCLNGEVVAHAKVVLG